MIMLTHEYEWEGEWEDELEGEQFFGQLLNLGHRALPALRRIGLQAARSALTGGGRQLGQEVGGRMGGDWSSRLGDLGGDLGTWIGGRLPQQEFEGEWETPQSPAVAAALMAHIGNAAANARTDQEAEAFLPALVPLATQILPRLAPTLMRAAPRLTKGLSGIVRSLRGSPGSRQLVRTVPSIMSRTVKSLGQQTAQGRPATPQAAVRTLAQQTSRVLSDPRQAVQAYRQSRALDHRYHQACRCGHGAGRPGAAGLSDLNFSGFDPSSFDLSGLSSFDGMADPSSELFF
jgi:hypothetical protein